MTRGFFGTAARFCAAIAVIGFAAPVWPQTCVLPLEKSAPDARFVLDAADSSVVIDNLTNLSWRRCAAGYDLVPGNTPDIGNDSCMLVGLTAEGGEAVNSDSDPSNDVALSYSWAEALEYAGLEGNAWRLPNIKELASILEMACISPAINSTFFPDALRTAHWSSTSHATRDSDAWTLSFSTGTDAAVSKNTSAAVLLVRD